MNHHISRRNFIKTSALALPLIAAGCAGTGKNFTRRRKPGSDFVTIRDGRFELRSRPYFYVGTNFWCGCYLSDASLAGGRARMIRELDRLQSIGVNNIRLLAGSEKSPLAGSLPSAITRAPHDYDEALLEGLDFCLAEMAKRDMRGIPFLSNYWQWSGGFAQYVRWVTGSTIPDPDLPTLGKGDWSNFMKFSARLYTTSEANELYRGYVSKIIHRRNTINGRLYRDDPTIMTWEIANEPRPGVDAKDNSVPIFARWVDETARFIHDKDPNHLVCTGSEGIHGCLDNAEDFVECHKSPAVDYVTVHMWLKNWSWLKHFELGPEYQQAAARAKAHVEEHNVLATEKLQKPLVMEEFGLPRDHEKYAPDSPTTVRDDYYRRMFDQVADSCKAGRALQGANFWAWAGEGRAGSGPKDSAAELMGDPFSEPQGLNTVFDTDKSTLTVIAQANEKLAAIAG